MGKEQMVWIMAGVIIGTGALVGMGKLSADKWEMVVAIVAAWLAPSPVVKDVSK